jgi:hypothetical protein
MEDAATKFHVQGLELNWSDLRYFQSSWQALLFKGNK